MTIAQPAVPVNIKSGLGQLLDDVTTYFQTNKVEATVLYGRRELGKQGNTGADGAARIVIAPTDDGKAGEYSRVAQPGIFAVKDRNDITVAKLRALYAWDELLIVSVWAQDPNAANDERKQREAVEVLREQFFRAVIASRSGAGNARFGKATWIVAVTERVFGAELRVELTLEQVVFDVPTDVTYPGPALTKQDH